MKQADLGVRTRVNQMNSNCGFAKLIHVAMKYWPIANEIYANNVSYAFAMQHTAKEFGVMIINILMP